jgi:magnesium-transporting ATPase (P-type)
VRGGKQLVVKNTDIIVGDVLLLNTGDKIIADGILIESFSLVIDEASLTGESDPMKKGPTDPWCRSGTQVIAFVWQQQPVTCSVFSSDVPCSHQAPIKNKAWDCVARVCAASTLQSPVSLSRPLSW